VEYYSQYYVEMGTFCSTVDHPRQSGASRPGRAGGGAGQVQGDLSWLSSRFGDVALFWLYCRNKHAGPLTVDNLPAMDAELDRKLVENENLFR